MAATNAIAQSFECRVENESFPSATTYEFDVKLYATGATSSWEYATATLYINMNSAFRNAGTITASIVSGSSELLTAQVPTSVSYQATNNYIAIAAKTPPGAGLGTIIDQAGKRVIRMRLTNTVNFSTTAAPNLTFRWASPNSLVSAYVSGANTPIASNTVTAGQKNCKTPNYWNGTSWNKGLPLDTTDAIIFTGTYSGSLNVRSLVIAPSGTFNLPLSGTLQYKTNFINYGTYLNNNLTVNVQAGANGTASPSGNNYVQSGANLKVTFTPNANYLVDSIIVNGTKIDSISSYTFQNITTNQSIRVTFKPIIYQILNISGLSGGSTNPSGNIQISQGSTQKIQFIPNLGYQVDSVIVNGIKVDSITSYTFTNINADQTLKVTFKPVVYTINITSSGGGTNLSGNIQVPSGGSQTISFAPNSGYVLDSVWVNGIYVDSTNSYTFTNIQSNQEIKVQYIKAYIVNASSSQNGTMSLIGQKIVKAGADLRVQFTANNGYLVDSVLVNGVKVDSVSAYTFKNINADQKIYVTFIKSYSVGVAGNFTHGSYSPEGFTTVKAGSNLKIQFLPDSGYVADQILVNGIAVDSTSSYTFINIQANQLFQGSFAKLYSITPIVSSNGNISPSIAQICKEGTSKKFLITPNPGYAVDFVKVNGLVVDSINSYTFNSIIANQTIEVAFVKLYQINAQYTGSGSIAPKGSSSYKMGSNITYDFSPNENYFVDQVLLDGVKINAVTNYTFSSLNADHELMVIFKTKIDSASLYMNFPTGISYQAVARDSAGRVLENKPVKLKFSIRENAINGNLVYAEIAQLQTNKFGLFTCIIGNNNAVTGTYQNIDWMGATKYLQVEIEQAGSYVLLGVQQLLSVPYANAAKDASRIKNANLPVYGNNAAALQAGLKPGELYRTATGDLKIVY